MEKLKIDTKEDGLKWAGIALLLKDKGYKCIVAGFEGSSDSGAIEYIHATEESFEDSLEYADSWEYGGISTSLADLIPDARHKFIEDKCYELINNVENWWDNDGGWGCLVIDVINNKYHIITNIRITNHETFEHNGKIEPV